MERPQGSAMGGLPDDPALEILSRVPAGSLRQLKRVARAWRDLLADPLHRKTMGPVREARAYGRTFSFSFLAKLPGMKRMVLLDSCNGLLLFGCAMEQRFGYIVCKPTTKQWVSVLSTGSSPPPHPLLEGDEDTEERHSDTVLMFDLAVSLHFRLVQFWIWWKMWKGCTVTRLKLGYGVTGQVSGSEGEREVNGHNGAKPL